MSMNIKPENRRLLEALDYLDDSIVADMLAEIKVPDSGKSPRVRPLRYILALAASVLLLGAVIPLMTYIIETRPAWLGFAASSPTESNFENYIITEDDLAAINDAWNGRFGTTKNFLIQIILWWELTMWRKLCVPCRPTGASTRSTKPQTVLM